MNNLYYYIFYKLSCWAKYVRKSNDAPQHTAFLTIVFLIYVNLLTLYGFANFFLGLVIKKINYSKLLIVLIFVAIAIPNYFLLLHKDKHTDISKVFRKENRKEVIVGNIKVWIYVITSLFLFFFLLFLYMKRNEAVDINMPY